MKHNLFQQQKNINMNNLLLYLKEWEKNKAKN